MNDSITGKNDVYNSDSVGKGGTASPVKPNYEEFSDLSHQTTPNAENAPMGSSTLRLRIMEPGSVWQIVLAALVAIAIGMIVTTTVDDVPDAVIALLAIPGQLWLRALQAVVLPMIVTAMILAIQRLRDMSNTAGRLGLWTILYYVVTTIIAIAHSAIMVGLIWSKLMVVVSGDALGLDEDDQALVEERKETKIHDVVVEMFYSLVPNNIVDALATNSLLAVLVTSVVLGWVMNPRGKLIAAVQEVEVIVMKIITALIYLAPIGVFFLIMPNLMRLDISEIGVNLGILIGGTLAQMVLHLFVLLPAIFFFFTRKNPYSFWVKNSKAWITAWGTASSAATMPVTMRCVLERGVPVLVAKFSIPLGTLINMDGTAIYFPIVVVFLAATQGKELNAAQYVVVCLLSTLASIGTTPIPSSSLVLTVMIAQAVDIEITGMYAVVVAIDWFLDRFRTAVNVSGDMFAAMILTKITGIKDDDDETVTADSRLPALRDDSTV